MHLMSPGPLRSTVSWWALMSYWPGRRPSTPLACLVSYKRAMSVVSSTGPVGLLPVYKEANMTSSDVVVKIRRLIDENFTPASAEDGSFITTPKSGRRRKRKYKVGHGGSLDPMATGVLLIGLGSGTKVMREFLVGSKKYRASALLGVETDTQDSTGTISSTADVDHVTFEMLKNVLPKFLGNIEQVPPMYSALKINGKKLCDLARKGEIVKRRPRPVVVHSIQLTSTPEDLPSFDIEVECSGGTYVRTLITDICRMVYSRGHMTSLERTMHGPFTLADCLPHCLWSTNYKAICENVRSATTSQINESEESLVRG